MRNDRFQIPHSIPHSLFLIPHSHPRITAIRVGALLLAFVSIGAQSQEDKEPPKVTWEETDSFRVLVKHLELKTAGRVRIAGGVARKEVTVSVRDAGFYQVLDALCKAHGDVAYVNLDRDDPEQESLRVEPGTWVEYPSFYHGHFKVILGQLLRTRVRSVAVEGTWVNAQVIVLAPPWIRLGFKSGSRIDWNFAEAADSEGKDVLEKRGAPIRQELVHPMFDSRQAEYMDSHSLRLKDFDIAKGLKALSGSVKLTFADSEVVRLAAEAGKSATFPGGTVTVDALTERHKDEDGSSWRIVLTVKPDKGREERFKDLGSVFERSIRWHGSRADWTYLNLRSGGLAIEVESEPLKRAPEWIELRARVAERSVDIPFRFSNATLPKDKP